MYFCRDINQLIMSYVESYSDPNEFFNKLAKWMHRTVKEEYGVYGNLENVFFHIHVRSEPVMPNTSHVLPWQPVITVKWDGDIKWAVIKIEWLNRTTQVDDYEVTQTISDNFDFETLWPRDVPVVPPFMFDVERYYMGASETYVETFTDPNIHRLGIVPREFPGRLLNAAATAEWLELS